MNHLVLYYDKYKTIPQFKTFERADLMQQFIQHKNSAGLTCYEYTFVHKYSVTPQVVKTKEI